MLAQSKKLFYAVEAVLYIGYNGGTSPISSKDIAGKQGLPPRYLEQIMQKLVHASILRGVRGPRGGYLLAREKRRISVGEICNVLREEEDVFASMPATPLGQKIVAPLLEITTQEITHKLMQTTIADLCERAEQKTIRKSSEERVDFTI